LRNDKSGLENLNDLAALIHRPAEKDYGAAIGSRARWRDLDDFAIVAKLRMEEFEVIPAKQVRAYAMFRLQRVKPFGGLRRYH
jgi:hypothetical protein